MKSCYPLALLLLGCSVFAQDAFAGKKVAGSVQVYQSGGWVHGEGSLGSARNSTSPVEEIGCEVRNEPEGSAVTCSATNAGGGGFSCDTRNSNLIAAARSINSDSYVRIIANPLIDKVECISISVENSSKYEPKKP
ncbi:hypothetical protein [Luteimonas panaciterrae]|uniref:hypothetical protein n=1 Tax=Luteimonas panaciterrae TaxID=363885 RepID=UPI001CFA40F7|nr:hypothetical protein [Luteimonas panaciterrae]